ncbi:MAG TPA: MlaD family protein [Chthoniobacterales bacterium]|nr:MlaD family protein [Chthoniobacterales bacterium]
MNRHERGLEFKVGIFVFFGLAMLGALVVQFGRLGEGFKTYYALTVRFSDASGLLKGSDVLLAGAKIGKVAGGPRMVREGNGVDVPLKIYDYIKIPDGSKFTVGSSGLLGDRFVNVTMPAGGRKAYLPPNAHISGARATGIDDLTREGGALVGDMRNAVQNINGTFSRLNQEALSPANIENLKTSIAHLSETTGALAESSKKLDGVIDKADATMSSTKKAADDLQRAVAEARKAIQMATEGKGLLAALLTNQQLANDLRALAGNLRAHGVLFYRDTAAKAEKPAEQTKPSRPSSGERR